MNERIASSVQFATSDVAATGEINADPAMPPVTDLRAALAAYRRELTRWIGDPGCSDSTLQLAGELLCDVSRECGMLPEHVLIAIHSDGATPPWGSHHPAYEGRREARYRSAIRLLLRTYFGLERRRDSNSRFAR